MMTGSDTMSEFDIMTPEQETLLVSLLRRQRSEFYQLRCDLSQKLRYLDQQVADMRAMLAGLERDQQEVAEDLDRFRVLYEQTDDLIRHYEGPPQ